MNRQLSPFYDIGDSLAIDFANSVVSPSGGGPAVRNWDDLLRWLATQNIAGQELAALARTWLAAHSAEADKTLRVVLRLRQTLRGMFEAVATQQPLAAQHINFINKLLAKAVPHPQLLQSPEGDRHLHEVGLTPPWQIIRLLALDGVTILQSDHPYPIRHCQGKDCQLYFRDISKKHNRIWCSMQACGNRAKAARHAHKLADGGYKTG